MLQDSGRSRTDQPFGLVVDQDVSLRAAIRDALEQVSISTLGASSGEEALERLRDRPIGLLVLGDCGRGVAAGEVARHALKLSPLPVVILLVDESDLGVAREHLDAGAFDLVSPPLSRARLEAMAVRALRQLVLEEKLRTAQRHLQSREGYHQLVGRSRSMERVRQAVDRLGPGEDCVWLGGEPGTGKKLVARSLHAASPRREHPFVVVHCAGVDETDPGWIWSRSFAEEVRPEPGWFERADGGSLFLDGVTELPLPTQESLVRALKADRVPEVRIIAASGGTPRQAVESGQILEELHEALAPSFVPLPPLAERTEDLALLARHFISTIAEINHLPVLRLAPDALAMLERHAWPGNVRELRNAIEHAVILATDGVIRGKDLPDHLREKEEASAATAAAGMSARPFRDAKGEVVRTFEQAYLADLLQRHAGNVTSASLQSGMLRSALQRLLRKYGLRSADFRKSRGGDRRRRSQTSPQTDRA